MFHSRSPSCSPFCSQPEGDTTSVQCKTPAYNAPSESNDNNSSNDNARTTSERAGHGHQLELKAPEARPNGLIESCGGENPHHRAEHSGSGTANINNRPEHSGDRRGSCCGGSEIRGEGGRGCYSSAQSGGACDITERFVARESPYRVQLSLSTQQRQTAQRVAGGGTLKVHPTGAQGGGEEEVEIPCYEDGGCDMYQLGRMQGGENDFAVRGPLHQSKSGGKVCGPVSRYALRLLVDRAPPYRCRIYAGGFNSR